VPKTLPVNPFEELAAAVYEDVAVSQVIRPAAILPENAARVVLVELAVRDARNGGYWTSSPVLWQRWDGAWDSPEEAGSANLLGSLQVTYGTPTRYAITIYRATVTHEGALQGWTVEALCDEALGLGGYTLADCPRADLAPPPPIFRMNTAP
jgi:hypothetical protein